MILGVGVDLVDIRWMEMMIQDREDRFMQNFTMDERLMVEKRKKGLPEAYARMFAVKGAVRKALKNGTKFEHIVNKAEYPHVELIEGAKGHIGSLIPKGHKAKVHISVSDEYPFATAYAVIDAIPDMGPPA